MADSAMKRICHGTSPVTGRVGDAEWRYGGCLMFQLPSTRELKTKLAAGHVNRQARGHPVRSSIPWSHPDGQRQDHRRRLEDLSVQSSGEAVSG